MPSMRLSADDGYRDPRADWRRLAACRSADPEMFFPVSSMDPSMVQTERAKAVCAAAWFAFSAFSSRSLHGSRTASGAECRSRSGGWRGGATGSVASADRPARHPAVRSRLIRSGRNRRIVGGGHLPPFGARPCRPAARRSAGSRTCIIRPEQSAS
jgi:hypothetical protein